jgi:hypothetical protein
MGLLDLWAADAAYVAIDTGLDVTTKVTPPAILRTRCNGPVV